MKFWKEHTVLRVIMITVFFVLGMYLIFHGWKMTGDLEGLKIMIVGVLSLLVALWIYNKPFETPSGR